MVWGFLRRSKAGEARETTRARRRAYLMGFFSAAVVAAVCFLLVDKAMGPLSDAQFCAACHEMQNVHANWQQSGHFTNSSGVTVSCVSCHLPPREHYASHLLAKAAVGARDVYVHYFGEYDAEKARARVLDTLPSERCLRCHGNLVGQPSSGAVEIVHTDALGRPEVEQYGCVACHDSLHPVPGEPGPNGKEYEPGDNSYCCVCHINFKAEEFVLAHVKVGVGCQNCHGETYPHAQDENNVTAPDIMYTKEMVNASCMKAECHPKEIMEDEIGHRPFFAEVDLHKHCTDCHGKHRLETRRRRWDKESRRLIEKDGRPIGPDEVIVPASSAGMM